MPSLTIATRVSYRISDASTARPFGGPVQVTILQSISDSNPQTAESHGRVNNRRDKGNDSLLHGLVLWPSALLLGLFIINRYGGLAGDKDNELQSRIDLVIELGCGVGLPGILCTQMPILSHVPIILTDHPEALDVLKTARMNLSRIKQQEEISECNKMKEIGSTTQLSNDTQSNFKLRKWLVRHLLWGDYNAAELLIKEFMSPDAESAIGQTSINDSCTRTFPKTLIIFGADVFYHPPQFDPLLLTVKTLLASGSANSRFYTTYQERSTKRSLMRLLAKWQLGHRQIPKHEIDNTFTSKELAMTNLPWTVNTRTVASGEAIANSISEGHWQRQFDCETAEVDHDLDNVYLLEIWLENR